MEGKQPPKMAEMAPGAGAKEAAGIRFGGLKRPLGFKEHSRTTKVTAQSSTNQIIKLILPIHEFAENGL